MTKRNYQLEMETQLQQLPQRGLPLLLHSCCGPCSTAVLERLAEYFTVTIYYYNPNIHPPAEYDRRLDNQRQVIARLPTPFPISLLPAEYDPAQFDRAVLGLEDEPEGGERCTACFLLRMEETARQAAAKGFPYFTTTLSVSPHKDAQRLNQIGQELGARYATTYLYGDFKKRDGYRRSVQLAQELELYRQTYCGCRYSVTP